jgi:cytochrome P450
MATGPAAAHDIFSDNHRWGDLDEWHQSCLALHEQGGIHRIEREGFRPFWAVIDHAALLEVERQPELFTNGPEPVLLENAAIEARELEIKTLIHMDNPDHNKYRRLTNDWFKPASIRRLNDRLTELSNEAMGKLESMGGECDFAVDVAWPYPLQVILKILGLPTEDFDRMMMLTQQLFGQQDPDLQRGTGSRADQEAVLLDFYGYFTQLTLARRENPTEDLASLIANGLIDDAQMPDLETLGYYVIVATAGHDTTSSAMAGGLEALLRNPDQLAKLQANPELINNAVEEMIRWTATVRHFMRTAQEDTEICGQEIKKGDWIYLSYKGANLDPKVFEDPLKFDIERPNADRHVSFGFGMHFCLGAQLARNEMRSLFSTILPRFESIELAGDTSSMKTTFVGGHKSVPIRYTLR